MLVVALLTVLSNLVSYNTVNNSNTRNHTMLLYIMKEDDFFLHCRNHHRGGCGILCHCGRSLSTIYRSLGMQ